MHNIHNCIFFWCVFFFFSRTHIHNWIISDLNIIRILKLVNKWKQWAPFINNIYNCVGSVVFFAMSVNISCDLIFLLFFHLNIWNMLLFEIRIINYGRWEMMCANNWRPKTECDKNNNWVSKLYGIVIWKEKTNNHGKLLLRKFVRERPFIRSTKNWHKRISWMSTPTMWHVFTVVMKYDARFLAYHWSA